jgi:hypothetical protein
LALLPSFTIVTVPYRCFKAFLAKLWQNFLGQKPFRGKVTDDKPLSFWQVAKLEAFFHLATLAT